MQLLQQFCYTVFGIMTILSLIDYGRTFAYICSGSKEKKDIWSELCLLVGLIGLLLTYVWL